MVRPCSSGCGRFLSSSDGHDRCFVCLGLRHAKAALVDESCSFCGNMTISTLRSRLNDLTVRVPAPATRSASSTRGSSSVRGQGDLSVTVWNTTPTAAVLQPASVQTTRTSTSSEVPCVSFGAPDDDVMSIAASQGGLDSSGSEDAAALPPSGAPALPVSDPEMTAMLSRAAVSIGLEWNPPPHPDHSRMDEWFLGKAAAARPQPTPIPFFPELHAELTKTWQTPLSARVRSSASPAFPPLDGAVARGYAGVPPVERSVAMQLCPQSASSRGEPKHPSTQSTQSTHPVFVHPCGEVLQSCGSGSRFSACHGYPAGLPGPGTQGHAPGQDRPGALR